MLVSHFKKILLLICFAPLAFPTQEKQLITAIEALSQKYKLAQENKVA